MKTTQKMIRNYLYESNSVDCTNWGDKEFIQARDMEGGFYEICRSHGVNGMNGLVMAGRKTGTYYVVPSRSSAIFLFPW